MADDTPPEADQYEAFLRLFTRDEFRIMAFIRTMVYDHDAAQDVFQETSLALWRGFAGYRRDEEFIPWALGVARNQVFKHYRARNRDRHIVSEALLSQLADSALELADEMRPRQRALEACVETLPPRQQELLRMFYGEGNSAALIAEKWKRSVHAVYKALKVTRRALLRCVEEKLPSEA